MPLTKGKSKKNINVSKEEEETEIVPVNVYDKEIAHFKGVAWTDLKEADFDIFSNYGDEEARIKFISDITGVQYYNDNPKSKAYIDFLYGLLNFCSEQKFTPVQTSTCFSILKKVFTESFLNTSPLFIKDSHKIFADQIRLHSGNPPDAIKIFELQQVKELVTFVSSSFYRHYKLYYFLFTEEQETDNICITISTETPMELRPLDEISDSPSTSTNINDRRPVSKDSSYRSKTESYYSDSYKTTTATYNTGSYTESTNS